jgi:hypothetical protein
MGVHASIAVCMTAMTSPASEPKPRMRSSCALTSIFMKPCFSPIACALSTAFVGSPAMARRNALIVSLPLRSVPLGERRVGGPPVPRVHQATLCPERCQTGQAPT